MIPVLVCSSFDELRTIVGLTYSLNPRYLIANEMNARKSERGVSFFTNTCGTPVPILSYALSGSAALYIDSSEIDDDADFFMIDDLPVNECYTRCDEGGVTMLASHVAYLPGSPFNLYANSSPRDLPAPLDPADICVTQQFTTPLLFNDHELFIEFHTAYGRGTCKCLFAGTECAKVIVSKNSIIITTDLFGKLPSVKPATPDPDLSIRDLTEFTIAGHRLSFDMPVNATAFTIEKWAEAADFSALQLEIKFSY